MVHSGAWDSSLEWEDKVVAVVGSGSSAIQLIEAMGPKVKELHCYQRNAAWVMPRTQKPFPWFFHWAFAYIPILLLIIRWIIFITHELYHKIFLHNSWSSRISKYGPGQGSTNLEPHSIIPGNTFIVHILFSQVLS
jgi:hypothetical protein